jgi:acyl-ACP thioesterase
MLQGHAMNTPGRYVFEHETTVQLFHTGAAGVSTISALCRFAQESAGYHAEALGFGMTALASRGIAWVLREQAMRVVRFPAMGERLRVQTWPTHAERLLCHRDYRILDDLGRTAALGTSAWFGLDLESRRPRRADSFFALPWEALPAPAFAGPLPELEAPGESGATETRTVRASDIDALGHMNNLRYVDWIADHLELHGGGSCLRFVRIRHSREVVAGDAVLVSHEADGLGGVKVVMTGAGHGREVCLARVETGAVEG